MDGDVEAALARHLSVTIRRPICYSKTDVCPALSSPDSPRILRQRGSDRLTLLLSSPLLLGSGLSRRGAMENFRRCPLGRSVKLGARGLALPWALPPTMGISWVMERAM